MTDRQLVQRYELAAALCAGLRVLDLSDAPEAARGMLGAAAAEGPFDAVVALDGLAEAGRRERVLAELERHARQGARVLAVFERGAGRAQSPRVEPPPEDAARALAARLPAAVVLRQFIAEGSVIAAAAADSAAPSLALRDVDLRDEDAAALIVASGFEEAALSEARASLRFAAAPVLLSYVRGLEAAHAELLRANRELMRERVGRDGSAAASLLDAQQQLEKMKTIAKEHEEHVNRVRAWYDAPRYHLVDRVRAALTKVPGFAGSIRLLWSLISTRAETPQLDAAANPDPDAEPADAAEVTRRREGLAAAGDRSEPPETSEPLEP
jgi:hypothetical protein